MADGARRGPSGIPLDMGGQRIAHLGRSSDDDGAARIDDIGVVRARTADATQKRGLYEKTMDSRTVTREVVTDSDGIEKVRFDAVPVNPAVDGVYLYATHLLDLAVHTSVRFVYSGPYGAGLDQLFLGWTQIGPGRWQGTVLGKHNFGSEVGFSFCDGIEPQDGDRFAAVSTNIEPSMAPHQGLFTVVDCGTHFDSEGQHDTYPVVQRANDMDSPADLTNGVYAHVDYGTVYGANWLHLLTALPITLDETSLSWEVLSSHAQSDDVRLLTQAQLNAAANADPSDIVDYFTGLADGATIRSFPTPMGGCNLSSLPDGINDFEIEGCCLADGEHFGHVWIEAVVLKWRDGIGTETELWRGASAPINSVWITDGLRWQSQQSAAPLDPLDNLIWRLVFRTDWPTPGDIQLQIRWNTARRLTRWKTTATFPAGGGTNYHPSLLGRDLAEQHPRYAITDAIGTATLSGSGTTRTLTLAAPYRSGQITVSTSEVIYRIDPTGWSDGQVLELFIDGITPTYQVTLVHLFGNTDGSDIYTGLNLETGAGVNKTFSRPVAMTLKKRADHWRLLSSSM